MTSEWLLQNWWLILLLIGCPGAMMFAVFVIGWAAGSAMGKASLYEQLHDEATYQRKVDDERQWK